MKIIALSAIKVFWEKKPEYADATDPVLAWYRYTLKRLIRVYMRSCTGGLHTIVTKAKYF